MFGGGLRDWWRRGTFNGGRVEILHTSNEFVCHELLVYNEMNLYIDGMEGTVKMQMQEASPYQQVLNNIRQLSPAEQLALVSDIVTDLRDSYAGDELSEAAVLAESPTFYRLIENGLEQVKAGQARPIEGLLDEL